MDGKKRWLVSVFAAVLLLSGCLPPREQACCEPPPRGCTIFTISQGDRVFFGGNGDWINFDSNYYWVDPGSETRYGAIYFGRPDNVQQGFNEKGLAYDSNGLPPAPVTNHPGREPVYGGYASYIIHILRACATVEEVIVWVQAHQWHEEMHDQMHFADASGDAVVISAGPDGRVAFTRKSDGDGFLVSTNFNLANPLNGSYPCWRYDRAEALLMDIDSPEELTAERAASVLDAVHVASPSSFTILSLVGDLPQGLVYVYLFHQFEAPIVLNVAEEIALQSDPGPLRDRFPPETVEQADRAYQRLMKRSTRCDAVGLAWLGLVIASLAALPLLARPNRRELVQPSESLPSVCALRGSPDPHPNPRFETIFVAQSRDLAIPGERKLAEDLRRDVLTFWALAVAALGPIGLLARWIATRGEQKQAVVEAIGDLPPTILGLMAAMATVVYVPALGQGSLIPLGLFYGLPLMIGLLLYHAPLLAGATRRSYPRMLLHRLPAVIVSTNLALAGLLGISFPLIKWHLEYCGACNLVLLQWWAIASPGALAGGLLLTAYQTWAVRQGFSSWSALVRGEAVSSPPWRRSWGWIGASFLILIAGIALAIVIPALMADWGLR